MGWNWTNSRSLTSAPARSASATPSPVETDGLVVAEKTWPMPPVARTTAGAWTAPTPSCWPSPMTCRVTPAVRPSASVRRSRTSAFSTVRRPRARTASTRAREISAPVASPPACAMRRRWWPPSRVSSRPPSEDSSKWAPVSMRRRTASGPSVTRMRTASSSHRPAPATRVSSRCCSGVSPSPRAAAMPPWAQRVEPSSRRALVTTTVVQARGLAAQGRGQAGDAGADDDHVRGDGPAGRGGVQSYACAGHEAAPKVRGMLSISRVAPTRAATARTASPVKSSLDLGEVGRVDQGEVVQRERRVEAGGLVEDLAGGRADGRRAARDGRRHGVRVGRRAGLAYGAECLGTRARGGHFAGPRAQRLLRGVPVPAREQGAGTARGRCAAPRARGSGCGWTGPGRPPRGRWGRRRSPRRSSGRAPCGGSGRAAGRPSGRTGRRRGG